MGTKRIIYNNYRIVWKTLLSRVKQNITCFSQLCWTEEAQVTFSNEPFFNSFSNGFVNGPLRVMAVFTQQKRLPGQRYWAVYAQSKKTFCPVEESLEGMRWNESVMKRVSRWGWGMACTDGQREEVRLGQEGTAKGKRSLSRRGGWRLSTHLPRPAITTRRSKGRWRKSRRSWIIPVNASAPSCPHFMLITLHTKSHRLPRLS